MNLQDPVLVFDLGGTKLAAGVLLPGYHLAVPTEIKTEAAAGPERVVARIVELGQQVLARFADAYPSLPAPRIVRASFEDRLLTSHQATPVLFTQMGANSGLVGAGLLTTEEPPGPERT